jgi:hypothetical protein
VTGVGVGPGTIGPIVVVVVGSAGGLGESVVDVGGSTTVGVGSGAGSTSSDASCANTKEQRRAKRTRRSKCFFSRRAIALAAKSECAKRRV